jgi:hypothetical protein
MRSLLVAKSLTPYQSPQYRAIAVAHTDMRPSPINLDRLTAKQIEVLRELIRRAGPANVASAGPQEVADGRSIKGNEMGRDRTKPPVGDRGVSWRARPGA